MTVAREQLRPTTRLGRLWAMLTSERRMLRGSLLEYAAVVAGLFLVTCIITEFTLFIPGAIFTGGVGDATSGFVYVMRVAQGWDPTLGRSTMSDYPFGDVIARPTYVTWVAILVPLWLFSRVLSATTALALVTVGGYVLTGLAMYGLVKRITGHWYVAVFAGYAAAFMPYHVYKSSDHLTNVYNVVVVLVVGFFLALWTRPTKLRAVGLGASVALACYTDGYYILIVGLTLLGLVLAALVADTALGSSQGRRLGRQLLYLLGAAGVAVVLMAPLVGVYATQTAAVAGDLASNRGQISSEAVFYSAHPIDFVLPADNNPIVTSIPTLAARSATRDLHSNASERTNYLGWTVMLLVAVGYVGLVLARRRSRQRRLPRTIAEHVGLLALPLVIVWAFGPQLALGSLTVPMPYRLIIDVTALWRVPSRMVLAVQPLAVLLAACVLDRLLSHVRWRAPARAADAENSRRWTWRTTVTRAAVSLVVTAALAVEYVTPTGYVPYTGQGMPTAYTWIRNQPDIHALIELPIGGSLANESLYTYAQSIHGRPIVNTSLGDEQEAALFNAVVGADNEEAINLARARGVDTAVVHAEVCRVYGWGRLVYSETSGSGGPTASTCVYHITDLDVPDLLFPSVKANLWPLIVRHDDSTTSVFFSGNPLTVSVVDDAGRPRSAGQTATLKVIVDNITTAPGIAWTATQDGVVVGSGRSDSATVAVAASIVTGSAVTLSFTVGDGQPPDPNTLETHGFDVDSRAS